MEKWKKDLVRFLFHYSARHLQTERGFVTKDLHVPEKLYKYRKFSKSHKKALTQGVLWRCSPDQFNDPYDTSTYFNSDRLYIENRSVEDFAKIGEASTEKVPSGGPPEIQNPIRAGDWRRSAIAEIISTTAEDIPNISDILQIIEEVTQKHNELLVSRFSEHLKSGFSIVCLSKVPTSILMWSHYSKSHTGFCIEYDFSSISSDDPRKRFCFPVYYRQKLTDATRYFAQHDLTNFNILFGIYLSLLKSDEWKYEEEWRIVHPIGPSYANSKMEMPTPSSIILGTRVAPDNETWMVEHCRRNDIRLLKVKQQRDKFRLEVTPYEE